jgi:hypothetical protein
MNDDYLWDKTGQPDPEIQQLEEILGTLRYQPRPLALPRKRNYFPLMAIAASLLLALLAGGIWLRTRSHSEAPKQEAKIVEPVAPKQIETPEPPTTRSASNPPLLATNRIHRKRSASSVLPERDREEALMAKEQLMLALRVTTQKLQMVRTKTQPNQIKNQHRVG